MNQAVPSRQGGTEDLWLEAAYRILTKEGVDAVKVMPLAKALGLSRTGFYWHFKDREALLEAMVRRWEQRNTGNLVGRCEAYAETICEAMFNLFDCWVEPDLFDARLDLAIRNWARKDPDLQLRLDASDLRRRRAVASMFRRFGYSDEEARVRAMTVIYTQVGYISMRVDETMEQRLSRMPAFVEVYTGQRPDTREFERFRARHGF
ncbi:TetR family transcriptional regulator [Aliiruegeria haliotis]|uniref:TetR family transcriptional regulator n=1 Tax=Aliiruegeria haliotis TaxID=1280846 RepID=A0A2T0RJX4_9RHOB|nr:TetR/AcrR family transcriptional regulator [Aliiruegeria haliotis]PRY21410.1 TetR family transcriptional regulator [Aliiruegeria haliotis]